MWKTVKLGDVIDVVMGQAPPGKACNKEGVGTPFVKAGEFGALSPGIKEWTTEPKKMGVKGDVFLCVVGATCGKINLGEDCSIGRSVAALRPHEDTLLQTFLYYFMSQQVMRLRSGSLGAAQTVISKDMINSMSLPLPPLAEQQRIVAKLDAAFAEIDRAAESSRSSSLAFEKLRERVIATELLTHTRNNSATMRLLSEVCDLQNGYAFKSKDYVEESNTLNIRMSNIRPNGDFDESHNPRFLPDFYANEFSQFLLNEGDLIIAMTDMAGDPKILGVPTLVTGLQGRNFLLNQRVGRLWKFSSDVYVPFLSRFLTTLKSYYKSKGAGGLQINISKKEILSAKIALPPHEEQVRSVERMDKLLELCGEAERATEEKIHSLAKLKSAILAQELQPPQSEAA